MSRSHPTQEVRSRALVHESDTAGKPPIRFWAGLELQPHVHDSLVRLRAKDGRQALLAPRATVFAPGSRITFKDRTAVVVVGWMGFAGDERTHSLWNASAVVGP